MKDLYVKVLNINSLLGNLIRRRVTSFLSLEKDAGSATLEFVALAIPLLIPVLLFSTQLSITTSKSALLHNALRESAHLFVSSNNDFLARSNVDLFLTKEFPTAEISIICDATPCLTHNSLVRFQISVDGISQSLTFPVGSWQ
jgi:hypothetical protein